MFFLPVDPRDENHRDPENIDYSCTASCPICAKTSGKGIRIRYSGLILILELSKEGLKFYQTKSNAIILQGALPASCIVRAERLKSGEKLYEKQYLSPRPPPKISLKHDLNWSKGQDQGSTVEHRPVGKPRSTVTWRNSSIWFFQANPIPLNPLKIVSGKPVTQEIVSVLQEELSSSDRSGKTRDRGRNNMSEITINQGNLMERKNSTQCKRTIISKVVIMWTSLTLRQTMRMLTSTSLAFLKKR